MNALSAQCNRPTGSTATVRSCRQGNEAQRGEEPPQGSERTSILTQSDRRAPRVHGLGCGGDENVDNFADYVLLCTVVIPSFIQAFMRTYYIPGTIWALGKKRGIGYHPWSLYA